MKNLGALIVVLLLISACQSNEVRNNKPDIPGSDTALGMIIADTIIYDVVITNHNPDDTWSEQRLMKLDRSKMIDNFFETVYKGEATAYDHTTGEKLTSKQVEKLEQAEGFNRNDIDMIQFKEIWFQNTLNGSITKKVISVVLGVQVFDNYGQYKANRALMRIEMN